MYNIGDRVIVVGSFVWTSGCMNKAEVISTSETDLVTHISYRYLVRYLDQYNTQGDRVTSWLPDYNIKIDTQYYREEKINKIINK